MVKAHDTVRRATSGYHGGKKVTGRGRHVAVDTEGWLLALVVTAASVSDKAGAKLLLIRLFDAFRTLRIMWADTGYNGRPLARYAQAVAAITVEVVARTSPHSFQVLRRRWVVERTFGWLMRYRRLARDYERTTANAEAMIYWATIIIMTRRLARYENGQPPIQRWGGERPRPTPAKCFIYRLLARAAAPVSRTPAGAPDDRGAHEAIGVPAEVQNGEFRVAVTPAGVHELTRAGHQVLVQAGAGAGSAIPDEDFAAAGAAILASADDVWAAGELVLKVKEPAAEEYGRLRAGPGPVRLPAPGRVLGVHAGAAGPPGHRDRLRDRPAGRRLAAAAGADVRGRRADGAAGGRPLPAARRRRPGRCCSAARPARTRPRWW